MWAGQHPARPSMLRLLAVLAVLPAAATVYFAVFWRWFAFFQRGTSRAQGPSQRGTSRAQGPSRV